MFKVTSRGVWLKYSILATAVIALSSCNKKNVVNPEPQHSSKAMAMKATAPSYDYTQPVNQIISDAGIDPSRVYQSVVIPGFFIYHGGNKFECYRWVTTCMIITRSRKHLEVNSGGSTIISGGTAAEPIGVIQGFATGPQYNVASSITYNSQGESTFIDYTSVD